MNAQLPHSSNTQPPSRFDPQASQNWAGAARVEMAKAIVGQSEVIEQLLLTLLCREHSLLEGVPGTAKWLAVEALGQCCGLISRRIRSSPDLVVEDLLNRGEASDPWQSSLLLVDDVASLPPKVRNLVQQAMSEREVHARSERRVVPDPFVVFAAKYPIDEHGTEEQVTTEQPNPFDDRFMFQIKVPYPTYHEEYVLAATKSGSASQPIRSVIGAQQLKVWQSWVPQVEVLPSVIHYAVRLVRVTRVHEGENPDFVYEWVLQGAGPRAAHYLILAAKARATLFGRSTALHEDVRSVCLPVLRHRILTNRNARSNGISPDRVIHRLIQEVPPQVLGDDAPLESGKAFTFHDWIPSDDRIS
jgi:MoxR-like ATPase